MKYLPLFLIVFFLAACDKEECTHHIRCSHITYTVSYCDQDNNGILDDRELDEFDGKADTVFVSLMNCEIDEQVMLTAQNNLSIVEGYESLGYYINADFHRLYPNQLICQ